MLYFDLILSTLSFLKTILLKPLTWQMVSSHFHFYRALLLSLFVFTSSFHLSGKIALQKDHHISLIGAGMGSRMVHYGHFETEMQLRFPHHRLVIRNMCDEGNTPGFRPTQVGLKKNSLHSPEQKFGTSRFLAKSSPAGFFENPDQWLTRLQTDIILAFFGFNSSFSGPDGLEAFKRSYLTLSITRYASVTMGIAATDGINFSTARAHPRCNHWRISKCKPQDLHRSYACDCQKEEDHFVDAYHPSHSWYKDGNRHTIDGALLNDLGNQKLAKLLCDQIFGRGNPDEERRSAVHDAVMDKNFYWLNDFKMTQWSSCVWSTLQSIRTQELSI